MVFVSLVSGEAFEALNRTSLQIGHTHPAPGMSLVRLMIVMSRGNMLMHCPWNVLQHVEQCSTSTEDSPSQLVQIRIGGPSSTDDAIKRWLR